MSGLSSELMIGNWLECRNRFVKIDAMDIVTIGNNESQYKRIELEQHILEVMGFNYTYMLNGERYLVNLKYNIGIGSNSVIQIINNKGFEIPNLSLKYVHKLQNYIFANFDDNLVFVFS